MSTTYYWRVENCSKCHAYTDYKIGLRSTGWQFSWTKQPKLGIFSSNGWVQYLASDESGYIVDESGNAVYLGEFFSMIWLKKKDKPPQVKWPESYKTDDYGQPIDIDKYQESPTYVHPNH
jgi:hypothetical protein